MAETESRKPATRKKYVPVRVVLQKGAAALIEWREGKDKLLRRGWLPPDVIKGDKVWDEDLRDATRFGVPWEELIVVEEITAEALANRLREAGFWTAEDLGIRPDKAQKEYGRVVQTSLAALIRAGKAFEEGE